MGPKGSRQIDGKCFSKSYIETNFEDARENCLEQGMDLIKFDNEVDYNVMIGLLGKNYRL